VLQERQQLLKLCVSSLEKKGFSEDQRYKDRLKRELKEIDAQGEHEYLLNLQNQFQLKGLILPYNQHNLLVYYLLDLCKDFDIEKEYAWYQGEFPDIDIDYLKDVRDYIKRTWAAENFGQDKICEIGTYGTSGIKSAVLDMARVHDAEKDRIQSITTKMSDKDEEGHDLEWEKALEIYPEFKSYCEDHPEVASAAEALLDRIRTGGVHAGGLIVSDRRLDGFVPLEVRMVNKENPNGVICSAWTEGLNRQDLGPVGLIKFDLLVISNLMQIALACHLIKKRHGIEKICAAPNQWDFSDLSYLNDPESLAMADKGDLKCIFQFDSEGIRNLVKRGGVSSFDDLAAYSAIYRPGPLNMSMDLHYCKRKRGEEPYEIHPLMQKSLAKTYGILVYQEQIMDILRVVGEIPDMHTEKVRKAISKKKIKDFIKYKEMFIKNGQKNLGESEEYIENLWQTIESFAEYGFNKNHSYAYTYISARLLWLKAHYPLEFYSAILMCETDTDKIKDYKIDAEKHGIEVLPIHINYSKENFTIHDNKIYFGFSNIKSIGEEVAKRIVANQPYKNVTDFLDRFGTDLTCIKALVSLGVFGENRIKIRKFTEYYKKQINTRKDRSKRFEQSLEKKLQELKELLLEEINEDDPDFQSLCDFSPESQSLWKIRFGEITREVDYNYQGNKRKKQITFLKQLEDIAKKRSSIIENFNLKEKQDNELDSYESFNTPSAKLDDKENEILNDELIINGKKFFPKAESNYYGFQWKHILETCKEYSGKTIDSFLQEIENQNDKSGVIQIQVLAVKKKTSKRGTDFYSMEVEDANGKKVFVNVWKDDYLRFKDRFVSGELLSIKVTPPTGGFSTFTFCSIPRYKRKEIPDKECDQRCIVLEPPKFENPKSETEDRIMKFNTEILKKQSSKNTTIKTEGFEIFQN
jgi:DNA polymerase III alpha subunit